MDGFQIFFNERRPFFVENKNIFDFQFANGSDNLFYSRRIGRNPQGSASVAAGAYVDQPNNTTILGAARLSGKTKNGWSLGLLETVTDNMFAKIIDNGEESKQRVEPMTNYLVGRAQKDFNNRMSYVGAMITATHPKNPTQPQPSCIHSDYFPKIQKTERPSWFGPTQTKHISMEF